MNNKDFYKLLILIAIISFAFGTAGGFLVSLKNSQTALAFSWNDIGDFFNNLFKSSPSGQRQKPFNELNEQEQIKPLSATISALESQIIKISNNSSESVVSIIISKNLPVFEQCYISPFDENDPLFNQFFDFDFKIPSQCPGKGTQKQQIGAGTGFIVSSDGIILTNRHVVADKDADYMVILNSGEKIPAKVLARDTYFDLAIIKINKNDLRTLPLGNSDNLKIGQFIIAIGNVLGEFKNTVSFGVISGLGRTIEATDGNAIELLEDIIQTDAAINRGNSGGPLINLQGEVVGMNTAIAEGAQNVGFAIPINIAKRAIESVRRSGKISIPFLGIRYILLNEKNAKQLKLSQTYGAYIKSDGKESAVIKDSPAEKAGLEGGDIITELNGEKITSTNSLAKIIRKYKVGDTITLKVLRDDKILEINITLGEL